MASLGVGKSVRESLLERELTRKQSSLANRIGSAIVLIALIAGVDYVYKKLAADLQTVHTATYPLVMLGIALFIALGFEFVNGFHDTANAVATVIYTRSMAPHVAVVWSGVWNFLGVVTSSGAVAYGILSLLPVELILRVSAGSAFAMVFALLIAAIVWNLATWWVGLPASSSHTLIGSIIGVGLMNQLLSHKDGMSGLDWSQVIKVIEALLFSPLVGFVLAALVLLATKAFVKYPKLFKTQKVSETPPWGVRGLLIATCTGVSFAHGSNDGQKGMGLIMLILIGTVPGVYALNHSVSPAQMQSFVTVSEQAQVALSHYEVGTVVVADAGKELERYVTRKEWTAETLPALRQTVRDVENGAVAYKSLVNVSPEQQSKARNQMYLMSETMRVMAKGPAENKASAILAGSTVKGDVPKMTAADRDALASYRKQLDYETKFIPNWVRVAVALALGLGTMVGWKRIVITVGEKIGKQHLSYAQGAAAEAVAMVTILAASQYGLPVSTTHVLSSGVAGTMVANRSGLQGATIRNIVMAWVFTLPAAAVLSGVLYWLFLKIA